MISIRQAITPRELEVAEQLERKLFPLDDPYRNYDAKWWLAWQDGEPVAFAAVAPVAGEPGVWFLARSGVVKSARGQNLQCRLIRVREAYARRMQGSTILTYTAADNLASANNLVRSGYKLYQPQFKWGCAGAIYFRKDF